MDNLIAEVIGDAALIIMISYVLGAAARRCGQPAVIGQILAGIMLGPSLLGRLPGHLTGRLFPPAVLPYLSVLSQVAIVIFMFAVGYELDWRLLHVRRRAVTLVAAAALLVPVALGSGTVLLFRARFAALGEPHISRPFILFIGVAMAITALPVLAAIIRERGLAGSVSGATATAAAGIMDVAAWLVLAALVGTSGHQGRPWPVVLVLVACFAAVMLLAVRPALRWWIERPGSVMSAQLPVALALALGSAWVTASLGLHPVFGGFLAGITMPHAHGSPDARILRPMEDVGGLLLPLFFVVTGLSVQVGDLDGAAFFLLALICIAACAGKVGPAYLASRLGGLDPRDSATVAVLVNTRGLTELIVLNVGLQTGLISGRLFSVLVLMTVMLTVMTAPLLSLLHLPGETPAAVELRTAGPPGRDRQ
jgi:Kef-type K+ transport system membrane component KefB